MKGNIYTSQLCPSCGIKMKHVERQNNCVCPKCGHHATKGYTVRFGRGICNRFKTYSEASRFLNGLRFKEDEGTFDLRDYRKDKPLSFKNQSEKWLDFKKSEVTHETYRKYKRFMNLATLIWGERNVKTISYGDIEDFLYDPDKGWSSKTKSDVQSCLNHFFDWLSKREGIKKPEIPEIKFELGWRTITDLDTQRAIIHEVRKIVPQEKIAFGIELLSTYNSLRPDDLRRITEGDYSDGIIRIHNPTKSSNKFKIIRLIEEDAGEWERLRKQYPALPHMPFFRHHHQKGVKTDSPFGKDLFYKWWKKACSNLNIYNLDLYGGTRHTTTTEIANRVDEASARKSSGHLTNKAFARYCQASDDVAFRMATLINKATKKTDQQVININKEKESAI